MDKLRVGVLISGNGSNLQALLDACAQPNFPAEIVVVISNKADAHGLSRAKEKGIPALVIDPKDYPNRAQFDKGVQGLLDRHLADAVCLAGFMRLLTPEFVKAWHNKLINIHPSLLPSFKGVHAHVDAIAAGVKISGCTVHFVRDAVDAGPIIVQAAVPVLPGDTPATLGARVLKEEHRIYPLALQWLAEGRLSVVDEKVVIRDAVSATGALHQPQG